MTDTFKLIVAGGRDYDDYLALSAAIDIYRKYRPNIQIISGMARGADSLGLKYAIENSLPYIQCPANWKDYGMSAGIIRNKQMANIADGLIAFWDNKSNGTRHMIQTMLSDTKPVNIVCYNLSRLPRIETPVRWTRYGGYECSTKGNSTYSAFNAILPDGRTIEQHYQCDVKGYDVGGTKWKLGKGKPPLNESIDAWSKYLELWKDWAYINSNLIVDLCSHVIQYNGKLSDVFATSDINQAHALSIILNENFYSPPKEIIQLDIF